MNEINETLQVAKGISDYGIMIMICAIFLVLAAGLMITCFQWFKSVIQNILNDYSSKLDDLLALAHKNGESMVDIAEGMIPETQMRIRTISNAFFDLYVERTCRMIKRIREENHISNLEATKRKINILVNNLYNENKNSFESFRYRGVKLAEYVNPEWVQWISKTIEDEIYNEAGPNNNRAFTNVEAVYDEIKLDFYNRLNK